MALTVNIDRYRAESSCWWPVAARHYALLAGTGQERRACGRPVPLGREIEAERGGEKGEGESLHAGSKALCCLRKSGFACKKVFVSRVCFFGSAKGLAVQGCPL